MWLELVWLDGPIFWLGTAPWPTVATVGLMANSWLDAHMLLVRFDPINKGERRKPGAAKLRWPQELGSYSSLRKLLLQVQAGTRHSAAGVEDGAAGAVLQSVSHFISWHDGGRIAEQE